jgi:hypothetical protein
MRKKKGAGDGRDTPRQAACRAELRFPASSICQLREKNAKRMPLPGPEVQFRGPARAVIIHRILNNL